MAQQMVNGSQHVGSITLTNRMSNRYAVVNPPFSGVHRKPQDEKSLARRKEHWAKRNAALRSRSPHSRGDASRKTSAPLVQSADEPDYAAVWTREAGVTTNNSPSKSYLRSTR